MCTEIERTIRNLMLTKNLTFFSLKHLKDPFYYVHVFI